MITKDLEAKLVTAITNTLAAVTPALPAHVVYGSWQPSIAGVVKGTEDDSSAAVIVVAMGTPSAPTFTTPLVTFSGNVSLSVRLECDPQGTALVAFAEPIEQLFKTWQSQTYQQAFTALDLDGLSVDEVTIQGGQPPQFNAQTRVVSVQFPFSLSGSYRSVQTTTNT